MKKRNIKSQEKIDKQYLVKITQASQGKRFSNFIGDKVSFAMWSALECT